MLDLDGTYRVLRRSLQGRVVRDEILARHTTYRVGGPAAIWIEAETVDDIVTAVEILRENCVTFEVLGKGSNVLAADAGFPGAIITLGPGLRTFKIQGTTMSAGAGSVLGRLVREALSHTLSGLEFAVGIPGTLGGALAMNAGTRDDWIGSRVNSVTLYDYSSGMRTVPGSEVDWGYRTSSLRDSCVICEATLDLTEGNEIVIRQASENSLRRRKASQPLFVPNAGSVFKNPDSDSAGRLIETAGLKGTTIGGAQVSEVHANFIVNIDHAASSDIAALVNLVQKRVEEVHGIRLTPEIRFLGAQEEH